MNIITETATNAAGSRGATPKTRLSNSLVTPTERTRPTAEPTAEDHDPTHNEAHDVAAARAECDPQADLPRAPADGVGDGAE